MCLLRTRPTPEFLLMTIDDGDSGLCKAEVALPNSAVCDQGGGEIFPAAFPSSLTSVETRPVNASPEHMDTSQLGTRWLA